MKITTIPLQAFLDDSTFRFSSPGNDKYLKQSIQANGIMMPLIAQEGKEKYRLISGFRRFNIAQELGLGTVPVQCMETESLERVFYHILLEQRIHGSFNLIEKSRILHILETMGTNTVPLDSFLHILELPNVPSLLEEVKVFRSCHPGAIMYIEKYQVSLKQALLFQDLSQDEQKLFATAGMDLQIRPVELSSLIRMTFEAGKRDNISILSLWEQLSLSQICEDDTLNRNEKIAKFKHRVYLYRYPQLHSWHETLEKTARSLNLPDFVRLKWDKQLESPGLSLRADLSTLKDAEELQKRIQDPDFIQKILIMYDIL